MKNVFSFLLILTLIFGFIACENDSVANQEELYVDSPDGDDIPDIETGSPDGDDIPDIETDSPDGDDIPDIETQG